MSFRFVPRLNRPVVSLILIAGFVVLTTTWLDARAQEAEWGNGSVPLLWPLVPADDPAGARRHTLPFHGPTAPDFTLPELRTGREVALSEFRGRPTVVLFGSFTCPLFCANTADLRRLHDEYGDEANFLFVHVSDARHDNPELDEYMRQTEVPDSARAGVDKYQFDFPCLDARYTRKVENDYSAWPWRVVILDADGDVYWHSAPGRRADFVRVPEAEQELQQCLAGGG